MTAKKAKKYRTDLLMASRELRGYPKCFLQALLTEPEYTKEDALKIAQDALGKER